MNLRIHAYVQIRTCEYPSTLITVSPMMLISQPSDLWNSECSYLHKSAFLDVCRARHADFLTAERRNPSTEESREMAEDIEQRERLKQRFAMLQQPPAPVPAPVVTASPARSKSSLRRRDYKG